MDAIEIRPPRKEEFHEVAGVSNLAFDGEVSPEDEGAFGLGFPFDRALCAYEGGGMVTAQLPPLYGAVRLSQPGAVSRPAGWWVQYLYDPVIKRGGRPR